jgi:hypothetical protein
MADRIGGDCRQPFIAIVGPAIFDRHVAALKIDGFVEALPKTPSAAARILVRL